MYRNENFEKIRNIQKDLYAYKDSKVFLRFFFNFSRSGVRTNGPGQTNYPVIRD